MEPLLVTAMAISDDSLIVFFLSVTFVGCSREESTMWRVVIHFFDKFLLEYHVIYVFTLINEL